MPDKKLCFEGEKCSGIKRSKDGITALLGTNMLQSFAKVKKSFPVLCQKVVLRCLEHFDEID